TRREFPGRLDQQHHRLVGADGQGIVGIERKLAVHRVDLALPATGGERTLRAAQLDDTGQRTRAVRVDHDLAGGRVVGAGVIVDREGDRVDAGTGPGDGDLALVRVGRQAMPPARDGPGV